MHRCTTSCSCHRRYYRLYGATTTTGTATAAVAAAAAAAATTAATATTAVAAAAGKRPRRDVHLVAADTSYRTVVVSGRVGRRMSCGSQSLVFSTRRVAKEGGSMALGGRSPLCKQGWSSSLA
ncbi:hypothetical protein RF55_1601 [Lasius niger]|uniref:Uncharacterized protein n=1 Tax=Lasius niger TaxID=67767 RepID=A0A0J7L6D2_LASNI|nr:hypothetical protein RF55_1601 [Lasius niger]